MTEPAVSVVVATRNRSALVARLVEAVAAQKGVDFELIVVDDGSSDGTLEVLERLAEDAPIRITPIYTTAGRGAPGARNVGWRRANAPLIAFTDDDCIPQPGWLATLVAHAGDADIVQGRTMPDPDQLYKRGPFGRTLSVEFEEGYYECSNILYPRDVLARFGGFDETLTSGYGEDTDLAWRAQEAGCSTAFVADALVLHEVFASDYRAHLRDMRRRRGTVAALAMHPEFRAQLDRGVFFHPLHPPALLAAAGLLALAGRPRSRVRLAVAAGLGLRYAWVCRKWRWGPRHRRDWLVVVPLSLGADLYTVAVMAKASIDYKYLLL